MTEFVEIVSKHNKLLKAVANFLTENGFGERKSPGLLQPLFGYPFSPSGGHHVIDEIIISRKNAYPSVLKFHVTPDRSMRMYDIEKIGISFRHLSFFETLVFGYASAAEKLPIEESTKILYNLMVDVLKLDRDKLFITTFGSCKAGAMTLTEKEDERFYDSWLDILGEDKVVKTKGRRNLFYSRVMGNPGGTGCEMYYKIGKKYIEIGSQVNYKFKFTGELKRTRNQAILEGFGFERLLMALENKTSIYNTSLLKPLKNVVFQFLQSQGDKSIDLYDETLNVITDHVRAIGFIIYDGQELNSSSRGKILRKFIKNLHSQFVYLGIDEKEEFCLIEKMFDVLVNLFSSRYPGISKSKEKIKNIIKEVVTQ